MSDKEEAQAALYQLKGMISELPATEQSKINDAVKKISAEVSTLGDYGQIALSICTMKWLVEND